MGRIAVRIEAKKIEATAEVCATRAPQGSGEQGNSNGQSMRFAPQEDRVRGLVEREARRFVSEIGNCNSENLRLSPSSHLCSVSATRNSGVAGSKRHLQAGSWPSLVSLAPLMSEI